jgi:hypothetical protein
MTITSVNSQTFLADAIVLIRDKLRSNISSVNSRVYTSYPKEGVVYPMITIVDRNISQPARLGMGSESTAITIELEIRIWARNVKERDEIFDSVYNYLRNNQLDDTIGLVASNLDGFRMTSAININEEGEQGIKSKVCEFGFLFICE